LPTCKLGGSGARAGKFAKPRMVGICGVRSGREDDYDRAFALPPVDRQDAGGIGDGRPLFSRSATTSRQDGACSTLGRKGLRSGGGKGA